MLTVSATSSRGPLRLLAAGRGWFHLCSSATGSPACTGGRSSRHREGGGVAGGEGASLFCAESAADHCVDVERVWCVEVVERPGGRAAHEDRVGWCLAGAAVWVDDQCSLGAEPVVGNEDRTVAGSTSHWSWRRSADEVRQVCHAGSAVALGLLDIVVSAHHAHGLLLLSKGGRGAQPLGDRRHRRCAWYSRGPGRFIAPGGRRGVPVPTGRRKVCVCPAPQVHLPQLRNQGIVGVLRRMTDGLDGAGRTGGGCTHAASLLGAYPVNLVQLVAMVRCIWSSWAWWSHTASQERCSSSSLSLATYWLRE